LFSCGVTPSANSVQILHGELEASLQRAQEDFASTNQELEKYRQLNDRLESDLLKLEQHGQSRGGQGNGDVSPTDNAQDDILAGLGLELGPTTKNVRCLKYRQTKVLTNLRLTERSFGTNETYTLHILRRYVYSSHRHQPTRPFPTA
jgi:hypothetical protein